MSVFADQGIFWVKLAWVESQGSSKMGGDDKNEASTHGTQEEVDEETSDEDWHQQEQQP